MFSSSLRKYATGVAGAALFVTALVLASPQELWTQLRPLIDAASLAWRSPDQGIWEVRTPGRVFTYSAAVGQVALERGALLAERFGRDGDVEAWRMAAR